MVETVPVGCQARKAVSVNLASLVYRVVMVPKANLVTLATMDVEVSKATKDLPDLLEALDVEDPAHRVRKALLVPLV